MRNANPTGEAASEDISPIEDAGSVLALANAQSQSQSQSQSLHVFCFNNRPIYTSHCQVLRAAAYTARREDKVTFRAFLPSSPPPEHRGGAHVRGEELGTRRR